jgi:hypothetical protein
MAASTYLAPPPTPPSSAIPAPETVPQNWLAALVYLQQIESGEIPDDDLLATLPWNIRQLLISSGLELLPDDASLTSFNEDARDQSDGLENTSFSSESNVQISGADFVRITTSAQDLQDSPKHPRS